MIHPSDDQSAPHYYLFLFLNIVATFGMSCLALSLTVPQEKEGEEDDGDDAIKTRFSVQCSCGTRKDGGAATEEEEEE